ncbi:unnamed protein product [Somion occarium]|uniref:Peptidase S26 domain-containing protein n=1 Tax=Somion occarium TaxID=3059160 RepID=A0ABP1CKZ8_9APHY
MVWLHNVQRIVRDATQQFSNVEWKTVRPKVVTALKVVNFVCAWHLFVEHVGWIRYVDGPSMVPTMNVTGEWIVENRMISPKNLARGDLITFVSPLDPSRFVCKRLIGLPGDVICVDPMGKYVPSTEHVVIPKGHIWLSGDNANASRDSREYGPVPMALVRGKFVARVWPLDKLTIFRSNFRYIDEDP